MCNKILVSFFVSLVFFDEMKVITSEGNSSLHFHALNNSSQNTSSDANISGEWTFFVDVCTFNSLKERKSCLSFLG